MGKSMARHLMKAGHAVSVFSRTRSRCEDFIAEGATWQDSVAGAAVGADMIITMVGLPSDVEQVYFGEAGLLSAAEPGTILIDMSTSRPDLAVRI
ncbi:MAG: NAD(P)-dependent oxidoreductase, partial [Alphaproteobacteria bacterium]|nr:NAD(P)-dependent oxidoreductase [Alphaproteobacteria bacterium]